MARTKAQALSRAERQRKSEADGKDETKSQRKPHRWRPGTQANRQIKKLQRTTDALVPKAAMDRLIRDIVEKVSPNDVRLTKKAMEALRTAAETYVVELMQVSTVLRSHAKRETLSPQDLKLADIIINTIYTSTSE